MVDYLKKRIAVVIPCYRSKLQILGVLSGIGKEVWRVYVIDDACPEGSGKYVEEKQKDLRISSASLRKKVVTDVDQDTIPPGLSEEVICIISSKKNEPKWRLDWRVKA